MNRNEKLYYWYSSFTDLIITNPIIVLYLAAKGLSFTEVLLIDSIMSISIFAFEVPTGALADKLGRKWSLVIGGILCCVSLFIYIIGNRFAVFAIAEVLFSLGAAFKSGADSALIYDSLKQRNQEDSYIRVEGKARSLAFYTQAFGAIIAGFVYEINIHLPMIISIGFISISVIFAFCFEEKRAEIEKAKSPGQSKMLISATKAYFKQIWESGYYTVRHPELRSVILYTMLFYTFLRAGFWFYQPYMEAVHIPVSYFGVIFFVFNIIAGFSSRKSHVLMNLSKTGALGILGVLLVISLIFMGILHMWAGVLFILLQQIAKGFYRPVITKYMNEHIPSDKRATVLSFQSLCVNLTVALILPLMGILKDLSGIFTAHLCMAFALAILLSMMVGYMHKQNINRRTSGGMKL